MARPNIQEHPTQFSKWPGKKTTWVAGQRFVLDGMVPQHHTAAIIYTIPGKPYQSRSLQTVWTRGLSLVSAIPGKSLGMEEDPSADVRGLFVKRPLLKLPSMPMPKLCHLLPLSGQQTEGTKPSSLLFSKSCESSSYPLQSQRGRRPSPWCRSQNSASEKGLTTSLWKTARTTCNQQSICPGGCAKKT